MGVCIDPKSGAMLKKKGCNSGYPDYEIRVRKYTPDKKHIFGAMYIELKALDKRVLKDSVQEAILLEHVRRGYFVRVCDSYESAVSSLEYYLSLEEPPEIPVEYSDGTKKYNVEDESDTK
jgi:hypothetical protein